MLHGSGAQKPAVRFALACTFAMQPAQGHRIPSTNARARSGLLECFWLCMPTFGAATGLQIGHYLQAAAHRRAPPRPEEVVCTSPYLKVLPESEPEKKVLKYVLPEM